MFYDSYTEKNLFEYVLIEAVETQNKNSHYQVPYFL